MSSVIVELGARSYPVLIGSGLLPQVGHLLHSHGLGGRVLVGTNPLLQRYFGAPLEAALRAAGLEVSWHIVQAGERAKRLSNVEAACQAAIAAGLDRGGLVLALGGGVIGDLLGFTAAVLYRGVSFVQVPTTLVAMVDSSVGGKTGVNSRLGKNLIGAFWQPSLVVADLDTLRSLPARELRCGMGEVIKHGCILDRRLFERLEAELQPGQPTDYPLTARTGLSAELLQHCVERSCELKGAVVAADERESGQRAWLNFGHTFGHALEQVAGYGKLHHGEAVAIGCVLAAQLGERRGDLPAGTAARIAKVCAAAGLPTRLPAGTDPDAVQAVMQRDKKVRDGRLRLVLLRSLGEAMVVDDTPPALVHEVLVAASREADDGDR